MERFYCADCYTIARLDTNGRCVHCGSRAVMSEEVLKTRDQIVEWGGLYDQPDRRDA